MKKILIRLKLIEYLETKIDCQKSKFVEVLKENVQEGSTGIFSGIFNTSSSAKPKFIGKVDINGFKIKIRSIAKQNWSAEFAVAKGTFTQKGKRMTIKIFLNGFPIVMKLYFIFCLTILAVLFTVFLISAGIKGNAASFAIPFLLIFSFIALGFPFFLMRKSLKRLKSAVKRELNRCKKKST